MRQRAVGSDVEHGDTVAVPVDGIEVLFFGADKDRRIVIVGTQFAVGVVIDAATLGQKGTLGMRCQTTVFAAHEGDDGILPLRMIVALEVEEPAIGVRLT